MKIAAIADLHYGAGATGSMKPLLEEIQAQADVLVIPGDLTDNGLPAEVQAFLDDLEAVSIPVIAILGNHDHESGQADAVMALLQEAGVNLLDGTGLELDGVGFVGTKGFCGGFAGNLVQPFGEQALKVFIQTSIDESTRLENAAAKLGNCRTKVGVLHYAPIRSTLAGEPEELFPFLGTSRLAEALDRQAIDLIVHGHAHHGSPQGHTAGGTPVYNVSRFVLQQHFQRPFSIFEV